MMVDGLSVCLPDDPAGNAKLMFSILECLPDINRVSSSFTFISFPSTLSLSLALTKRKKGVFPTSLRPVLLSLKTICHLGRLRQVARLSLAKRYDTFLSQRMSHDSLSQ